MSLPLLQVRNLSVCFSQGEREVHAVRDISFSIEKGQTLALVGESGSGKSVTALSIPRLIEANLQGEIIFKGQDLLKISETWMRAYRGTQMTMVFQEPMTSLNPLHTVEQQISEIFQAGSTSFTRRKRVIELLQEVGISDPASRLNAYPHQLSGGQRQRVMIAMALANRPDLLIADEPTTALDVTIQAQILELLKDLQRRYHMALLFITHDLNIVQKLADDVCVLEKGYLVEKGSMKRVFHTPRHTYTKKLLASEPQQDPPSYDPTAPLILEARDVRVWFPLQRGFFRQTTGYIKAVDGVDVKIRKGQTIGVVGESGSGKTTLGLALLRLLSSRGEIFYEGERIDAYKNNKMRPLRQYLQIVFQDPQGSLSPRLSIAQIVEEGLLIQNKTLSPKERRRKVESALAETGLEPNTMDRYPHEFSGGQRQRIAIARALVLEPRFLMLDEPTSALDVTIQCQILDLLRDVQKRRGLSYLFISHDLRVIRAMASEVIVMQNGQVVEEGLAGDIFANPKMEYTQRLLQSAFLRASP